MDVSEFVARANGWATENVVLIVLTIASLILAWNFYLMFPRYKESRVARKKERADVADIVAAALQDAVHQQKIKPATFHRYMKKLGVSMGIPDLIPMPATSRLWFSNMVDVNKAKQLCRQRLSAMGVDIAHGLEKMRRGRPSRQERLMNSIKRKGA